MRAVDVDISFPILVSDTIQRFIN